MKKITKNVFESTILDIIKESITSFICFFPHRDLDNTAATGLIYGTSIHFYENMKKVLKITTVMNYESMIFYRVFEIVFMVT